MPLVLPPLHLLPGDRVTICGRPETVTRVKDRGAWVHVHVVGGGGDPFLFRPHDAVPVTARAN